MARSADAGLVLSDRAKIRVAAKAAKRCCAVTTSALMSLLVFFIAGGVVISMCRLDNQPRYQA